MEAELRAALAKCDDAIHAVDDLIAAKRAELTHITEVLDDIHTSAYVQSQRGKELRFRDPFCSIGGGVGTSRSAPPLSLDAVEQAEAQRVFPHPNTRHWSREEDVVLDVAVMHLLTEGEHEDSLDWKRVSDIVAEAPRSHYHATDRYWAESASLVNPRTPAACQLRFINGLRCWNGSRSVAYVPFSHTEDQLIMERLPHATEQATGSAKLAFWERVASECPGRTPFQLLSRYFHLVQQQRRRVYGVRGKSIFDAWDDRAIVYFGPEATSLSLLTAKLNLIALEREGRNTVAKTRTEVERRCRTLGVTLKSASIDVVQVEPSSDGDDDDLVVPGRKQPSAEKKCAETPRHEEKEKDTVVSTDVRFMAARAVFGDDMSAISSVVFGGTLSAYRLEKLRAKDARPAAAAVPAVPS